MKLIDKDTLVAEIESLKFAAETMLTGKTDLSYWKAQKHLCERILSFLDTFETKEEDLEKEIDDAFLENKCNITDNVSLREFEKIAKHFFELGLKAQHSSIGIPNIDDIFEEEGIDPNSKDAKIFKECYYMALEKLKAQKGE